MTLAESFQKYEFLMHSLKVKVYEYLKTFNKLDSLEIKESVLQEKISAEELDQIEKKISNLETDIENLYIELLNHTNLMIKLLQKEDIYDFNLINNLNREHISAMTDYISVIAAFKKLEKDYTDYDFSIVDFSKMEKQKIKLNNAIAAFNKKFLQNLGIELKSVYDCEREARQFFM